MPGRGLACAEAAATKGRSMLEGLPDLAAGEREALVVQALTDRFGSLMVHNTAAFRAKFRTMAASPYAFYRGSACLFYADLGREPDPWAVGPAARIWVHGDLHAGNFGTYLDARGRFVFDVNDFDESYLGAFVWDLRRLAVSVDLLGHAKAFSDDDVTALVRTFTAAYLAQVRDFSHRDHADFALTLESATGPVLEALRRARLRTRVDLLQAATIVESGERRFAGGRGVIPLAADQRERVAASYEAYLERVPPQRRAGRRGVVKDIVARRGVGVGSAGLPSYNVLVEGPSEALENDIVLFVKQAQSAAPQVLVPDVPMSQVFVHDGHRTAEAQLALQANADPWLGHTIVDGAGMLVAEVSPYAGDLDWDQISEVEEADQVLGQLGRATAKMHCVSDVHSDRSLVPFCVDEEITALVNGADDQLAEDLVRFAHCYGAVVRRDHALFQDAFRNHRVPGLDR